MIRLLISAMEFVAAITALVLGFMELRSRLYQQQPPRIEQPAHNARNEKAACKCAEGAKPAGTTVAVDRPKQPVDAAPPVLEASLAAPDEDSTYGTVFTFQELTETRTSDRMVVEMDDDSR